MPPNRMYQSRINAGIRADLTFDSTEEAQANMRAGRVAQAVAVTNLWEPRCAGKIAVSAQPTELIIVAPAGGFFPYPE